MTTSEKSSRLPPAYQIQRFNENYSYLDDPAKRTDLLDAVKYIPLRTDTPAWHLTFGGEIRDHFAGNYNPDFGIHGNGPDSYWLQRATFLADLALGDRLRIFAEGISGVIEGENRPAPLVQNDPIDLAFAFVDVVPYMKENESLTVRGGRFGMSLGSSRLVATRAGPGAPNIPLRFDGVELLYACSQWKAAAFLTRPVEDKGRISGSNPDTSFWGLYVTRWINATQKLGIDVYYLGLANEHAKYASESGNETRHSFGARIFGSRNCLDWNGEGIVQAGTFGEQAILAWTASLDAGYTWDALLQPRMGLKVDVISGDGNPHDGIQGTFNPLYPSPNYFNEASMIRPESLIDAHPNLAVNLTRALSINGGADFFWRYSQDDGIYAVPGFVAIPALKTASSYVGTALDINLQWKIQRHLTFGASYVHFFTGSYVHKAGGSDVNYVSTTLTFLF